MPKFILAPLSDIKQPELQELFKKLPDSQKFQNIDFDNIDGREEVYNELIETLKQISADAVSGGDFVTDIEAKIMTDKYKSSSDQPHEYNISVDILKQLRTEMDNLKSTSIIRAGWELGMKFYFGYNFENDMLGGRRKRFSIIIVPVLAKSDQTAHTDDEEASFLLRRSDMPQPFFGLAIYTVSPNTTGTRILRYNDIRSYRYLMISTEYTYAGYYSYDQFFKVFIDSRPADAIKYLLVQFGRLERGELTIIISAYDNSGPIIKSAGGTPLVLGTYFDNGDLYPPSKLSEEIF